MSKGKIKREPSLREIPEVTEIPTDTDEENDDIVKKTKYGEVKICQGKYSPVIMFDDDGEKQFIGITEDEMKKITVKEIEKRIARKLSPKQLEDDHNIFTICDGMYGPFIRYDSGKKSICVKIPKSINPDEITIEQVHELIIQKKPRKKVAKKSEN